MPGMIRHFYTKVAGVTHRNADRSDRQRIIADCKVGEKLLLDTEPNNLHDPDAVRVIRANGQQLGYLPAHLAGDIAPNATRGYLYAVFIANITGGDSEWRALGVNLLIVEAEATVSSMEAQSYIDRALAERPDDHLTTPANQAQAIPGQTRDWRRFACHFCNGLMDVPPACFGQIVNCPLCGNALAIPTDA